MSFADAACTFVGSQTDVEVHVETDDAGRLRMRQGARDETAPLRALENGRFAIDGTPMTLEFAAEDGIVTGIRIFRGARTIEARRLDD